MWNWWIWHRYGPVLPQPKVLRSLGTQTCPSFLWEFIFCLPKSPKSISTGMDLFLWYLWNLWYLLCFQVWKWLMISNFWTCTYNFDVFFSGRRCPKSGAPGRALKTRVPSWRFLSVPWPWRMRDGHGSYITIMGILTCNNMYIYIHVCLYTGSIYWYYMGCIIYIYII